MKTGRRVASETSPWTGKEGPDPSKEKERVRHPSSQKNPGTRFEPFGDGGTTGRISFQVKKRKPRVLHFSVEKGKMDYIPAEFKEKREWGECVSIRESRKV